MSQWAVVNDSVPVRRNLSALLPNDSAVFDGGRGINGTTRSPETIALAANRTASKRAAAAQIATVVPEPPGGFSSSVCHLYLLYLCLCLYLCLGC